MNRVGRLGVVGAVVFAIAWLAGVSGAAAAPNGCSSYGVGVAIIPQFVGTNDLAVTAYPGEMIDYDVTVFLRQDPPGTPNGVSVCPIFDGTLTVVLPDGTGPFTIATGVTLAVGGSVRFENVPSQKYTMSTADVLTAPGCQPGGPCFDRVLATAHVEATSQGLDDGAQDDAPVAATSNAPTFLLAPSTQLTLTPSSANITAGDPIQWTVTETNDTPPRYFPLALSDAHVDLSTDDAVTTFARLDVTSSNFSGDADSDQQLDVGETWRWTFTTTPLATTTLTATGFGTGARNRIVTFPADAEERSQSVVQVTPAAPPSTSPPSTSPPSTSPPSTSPPSTSPPTTSPATTLPSTPTVTTPPGNAPPPTGELPETGASSSVAASAIAGAFSVAVGGLLVALSRRRQAR